MPLPHLQISAEVQLALQSNKAVVALESTVITHGLPHPQNLRLARDMEATIRGEGAVPATIGVLDGTVRVGLSDEELQRLSEAESPLKVSRRDFATAVVKNASGGTTVAGTIFAAHRAGIQVFATGGIGGVHKENAFDVSADLQAMAQTPVIVVCAGAKAILDMPATLEYLETMGVPVVGYQCGEFPAFYSRESGLGVSVRLDSPVEIATLAKAHWTLGTPGAVLVANPIPAADAIPGPEIEPIIAQASREARDQRIHGQELTPFLLQRVSELSGGKSLRANLGLLINNARLAAQIAVAIVSN
jgi:pseudouridine-5'-phosphate glycosidase